MNHVFNDKFFYSEFCELSENSKKMLLKKKLYRIDYINEIVK